MEYQVLMLPEATKDIEDIHRCIQHNDSPDKALHVLDQLEELVTSLAALPERGHYPPELDRIGIQDYREVHFRPYRVIHEIGKRKVFIHAVLDGRRDIHSLLARRLTR